MRAIINMASPRAAVATGWRAQEIKVEKAAATLEDILRATPLKEGALKEGAQPRSADGPGVRAEPGAVAGPGAVHLATLFDLVTDEHGLRSDFSLFISGDFLRGDVDLKRPIRDSEQIHLWDWPFSTRDS